MYNPLEGVAENGTVTPYYMHPNEIGRLGSRFAAYS